MKNVARIATVLFLLFSGLYSSKACVSTHTPSFEREA